MNHQTLVRRELYPKASVPSDQAGPVIDFRSSDQTLDRYQELITVKGWRLENYWKNPVVQNAHSYCSLADTIGKSLITEVRGLQSAGTPDSSGPERGLQSAGPSLSQGERAGVRAEFSGPQQIANQKSKIENPHNSPYLFQRILFAVEENPMAKVAYGLYKGGFLNAVSVGFIPLRWENGSEEKGYRRKYLEQELLEVSAVSIPANPNALTLALKSGAIEKSDLKELADRLKHFCESPLTGPSDTLSPGERDGVRAEFDRQLSRLTQQLNEIRTILKKA